MTVRPWQLAAACLAALAGACSDGYSTRAAAPADPHAMTPQQRLAAMNRLGQQAHPDLRWRYDIGSPCELRVTVTGSRRMSQHVRLEGVTVGQSFDQATTTYLVTVTPADRAAPAARVLETPKWTHSVEMFSFVRLQQRDCVQPPDASPPSPNGEGR
jgi:hypothetical protein